MEALPVSAISTYFNIFKVLNTYRITMMSRDFLFWKLVPIWIFVPKNVGGGGNDINHLL